MINNKQENIINGSSWNHDSGIIKEASWALHVQSCIRPFPNTVDKNVWKYLWFTLYNLIYVFSSYMKSRFSSFAASSDGA